MADPGVDVVKAAIAYRLSRAIAAAAELDVATHLRRGPVAVPELARRLDVDVRGLRLLVRALVSEGIFAMPEADAVALNEAAGALLSSADGGQRELFLGWYTHNGLYLGLADMAAGIRRGEPAFAVSQGVGFFDWMLAHPIELERYQLAVGGADPDEFSGMLDLVDLAEHRVIADIGGGQGGLLRAALDRWPHLQGILIDLPAVVDSAKRRLEEAGYTDRIRYIGADCVESVPGGADVYVMTTVLRYFPDDQARKVLRNVFSALSDATGPRRVLLVEMPPDDGPPTSPGAIKSLVEYALTGGEDRSNEQLGLLLEHAGFSAVHHQHWEGPFWITSAALA